MLRPPPFASGVKGSWGEWWSSVDRRPSPSLPRPVSPPQGEYRRSRGGEQIKRTASSNDSTVARPARQLVTVGQLQLPEHRRNVRLHSLDRQVEPARHLLVSKTAGD